MLFLLMLACASQTPDTGPCVRPTVTWDSFGQSFLITHCQGCHASTSPQRYGAPEGLSFDTREQSAELQSSIERTVLDQESMPPAGGLNDDERELLAQWLACGI
ncbi:MAG: putative membrane protein [Cognaticolwellia sp.]|jgi:uncharacterized membrane protein